jgi:hypothetical protein
MNIAFKKNVFNKKIMIRVLFSFSLFILATSAFSKPKHTLKHKRNDKNLAEIQITNQTVEPLICYVAIDGHKIYFRLKAYEPSIWYRATDVRYNYSNFSVWCDYLSLHSRYAPKKK